MFLSVLIYVAGHVHILHTFVSVPFGNTQSASLLGAWSRASLTSISLWDLATPHRFQPPKYNCLVGRSCPKFPLDITCFQCWVKQEVAYPLPEQCRYGKPAA